MISVKPATRPARRHGIMFAVLAITGVLIAGNQASSAQTATAQSPGSPGRLYRKGPDR
jgi:hypothetical protein